VGEKLIEIKITKATLFLTEQELLNNLPPSLIEKGLRRGKSVLRFRNSWQRKPTQKKKTSADYRTGK